MEGHPRHPGDRLMPRYDGGAELRERVVSIYRVFTGSKVDRGAIAWFARECDVGVVNVSRWLGGHREIPPIALKLVEALEAHTATMIAERNDSGRFKNNPESIR